MNQAPPKKIPWLPKLIVSAFILGAVLWGLWMYKFIWQTRADHPDNFFVPMKTNSALVR